MSTTTEHGTARTMSVLLQDSFGADVDALRNLVRSGAALQKEIDALESRLSDINRAIMTEAPRCIGEAETLHIQDENIKCTVDFADGLIISDVGPLYRLFGVRFTELIKTDPLRPDPRLVAMAADADNPQSQQIASCLQLGDVGLGVRYTFY